MADRSSPATGLRRQPRQARSQERVNRILAVAQAMFVAQGYDATTTNAIAARAQVPIGSLYQFFPDKAAILQALAIQYGEQLHQHLTVFLDPAMVRTLSLPVYVERLIDAADQFFTDQPGYYAIFMEVQGNMPELERIEDDADQKLIQDWSGVFAQLNVALTPKDCEAIAFVLVKAIGTLLWVAIGQGAAFRQRLVTETKRLTLGYLQGYFPDLV
jgi:AcrR family transcriptional regulator